MYFTGFHGFQGSEGWRPVATCGPIILALKKKFRSYSIYLRVLIFESSMPEGLLNRSLATPPIPFESGVDFSLNCSVCLVKVSVFNLCHLVPHFQKRCKVCKFALNCPVCLVKLTVLKLCPSVGVNP